MRPCPPELQRRAIAFDRVIEALQAVRSLREEDLDVVSNEISSGTWHALSRAVRGARDALAGMADVDRALNAELEALDMEV